MNDQQWKCGDGRTIKICDMEDSHLLNSLFWIERNSYISKMGRISELYPIMINEAVLRKLVGGAPAHKNVLRKINAQSRSKTTEEPNNFFIAINRKISFDL